MKKEIKTWWQESEIEELELSYLHTMFDCTTQEGVDVAFTYAKFMAKEGVTPDNYPIFLKLMSCGNHWIVDALIADNDPENLFKSIQPNSFILSKCFKMLRKWKAGEIYPKLFLIILGILKVAYENALEGYKLFPITPEDINHLGKQLDRSKGQSYPTNRALLHILDRIAEMIGNLPIEDKNIEVTANQANKIRGKFLDESKSLEEAIPVELLKKGDYTKNEISPSIIKKS
jgi:hypothetical protein